MRNRALPYAWAFAVLALFALAACGGGGKGPTDPGQGGPPPNPTIEISATSMPVNATLTVRGSGFTPGGTVTLHRIVPGFGDLTANFGLDPKTPGAFVSNMSVSNVAGEYTMWAVDDASGRKSNEVKYTVTPATQPEILWTNRIGNGIDLVFLRFTVGGKVDVRHVTPSRTDTYVIDFEGRGGCTSPCEILPLRNLENGQHAVTAVDRTTGVSVSQSFAVPAP